MDHAEGNFELSHTQDAERKKWALYQNHKFFYKFLFVELLYMGTKNSYKRTLRLQMSTVASWLFEQLNYLINNNFILYSITEKKKKKKKSFKYLFSC